MKLCPTCLERYAEERRYCTQCHNSLLDIGDVAEVEEGGLMGEILEGKYLVKSVLGSGAMGTIYRAFQVSMRRDVAIKVLNRSMASDPDLSGRFIREAVALSQVSHPHIVTIFDQGQTPDGLLFMAQEILQG